MHLMLFVFLTSKLYFGASYFGDFCFYYIPINDTSFELSVFWPSNTESQINELRFSDSESLSFKSRLMSVTCFLWLHYLK